jgi:hypothetical protein
VSDERDIVERLRDQSQPIGDYCDSAQCDKVKEEAAAEIARLREERIEEPLALLALKHTCDRIINDARLEFRKTPWLWGKPATELSKRELLALAILQANPMSSYVSKEES